MFESVKKWVGDKFGDSVKLAAENAALKKNIERLKKDYDKLSTSFDAITNRYESLSKKYFALVSEKQQGRWGKQ